MVKLGLVDYGLGVVSLFPLVGSIQKLAGFYPPQRRAWFVTLSTVFSAIVFIVIASRFEHLRIFVPIWLSATSAAVLMLAYVILILATDRAETVKDKKITYGLLFGVMLVTYTGSIALLTYTFNVLKQLHEFDVYRGQVRMADSTKPVEGAAVEFVLMDQSKRQTASDDHGKFIIVIPRNQLSAVHVDYQNRAFCATLVAERVPADERFVITIERCPTGG